MSGDKKKSVQELSKKAKTSEAQLKHDATVFKAILAILEDEPTKRNSVCLRAPSNSLAFTFEVNIEPRN